MAEEQSKKSTKDPATTCSWCGVSKADGASLIPGFYPTLWGYPPSNICARCCRLVAMGHKILPPDKKEGA